MFTDRFIKVPVKIFDVARKELTGKEELFDSFEKINPFEIATYRPAYGSEDEEGVMQWVNITFKNGDRTLVYLSMEEFEKLLNTI
jgi:hypothetical protein